MNENKNVVRFTMLLAALYRANPEAFAKATEKCVVMNVSTFRKVKPKF